MAGILNYKNLARVLNVKLFNPIFRFIVLVVGVEMERSLVQNIMNEITHDKTEPLNCADPTGLHCYLLNGGGVVVATNQPEVRAGEFIGLHDPQLLIHLLDNYVLGAEYRYNYHSWCSKQAYQVCTYIISPN